MWVRSSTASYGSFNLDMDRSPGFGSAPLTLALLRLGFPTAPILKILTLPVSATRRTVLQKVRGRACKALPQLVDTGFQVLFHSPPGVLFTFPSQYYALSVTKWYLALGVVPLTSRRVSRVPRYSGSCSVCSVFVSGAFTLSGRLSQNRSTNITES